MQAKMPFWLILLLIAAIMVVGLVGDFSPQARWVAILAMIAGFLVLIGMRLNGRWDGILIDSRFKMSLARFQICLWTLVVFSAFFTIALERNRRTADENFDPLKIVFPAQLLLALGISTASLAGASVIKNVKKERESGRSLDLVTAEREGLMKKQQEALKAKNDSTDSVRKLSVAKNDLRKSLDAAEAGVSRLQEEVSKKQAEVSAVEESIAREGSSEDLREALKRAERELEQSKADLAKEKASLDAFKKRYEAGVSGITEKANRAAKEEELANITYERATEELKKIDELMKKKEGLIHKNDKPEDADWIDIFRGDEIGNYNIIDVSKIQMFLLTIAIVFTYAVRIWISINEKNLSLVQYDFPAITDTMNALLGISHAGYLTVKGTG